MHKPGLVTLQQAPSNRARLVEAMRSLALAKGFPATTVDEICERAEVTKGAFYHHFGSKDELGRVALRAYHDDVLAAFAAGSWAAGTDPGERLAAFLAHAAETVTGPVMTHGCLLGSFALELAVTDPEVRVLLGELFGELRDFVAALVAEAAAANGATVDAPAVADQFLVVVEGAAVLAKAYADPAAPRRAVELFARQLSPLLG